MYGSYRGFHRDAALLGETCGFQIPCSSWARNTLLMLARLCRNRPLIPFVRRWMIKIFRRLLVRQDEGAMRVYVIESLEPLFPTNPCCWRCRCLVKMNQERLKMRYSLRHNRRDSGIDLILVKMFVSLLDLFLCWLKIPINFSLVAKCDVSSFTRCTQVPLFSINTYLILHKSIYTYIHIYIYTHTVYTHIRIYTCTCTCTCTSISIYRAWDLRQRET